MANVAEIVNHNELVELSTLNDFVHAFQRGEVKVVKSTLQIGAAYVIGTFATLISLAFPLKDLREGFWANWVHWAIYANFGTFLACCYIPFAYQLVGGLPSGVLTWGRVLWICEIGGIICSGNILICYLAFSPAIGKEFYPVPFTAATTSVPGFLFVAWFFWKSKYLKEYLLIPATRKKLVCALQILVLFIIYFLALQILRVIYYRLEGINQLLMASLFPISKFLIKKVFKAAGRRANLNHYSIHLACFPLECMSAFFICTLFQKTNSALTFVFLIIPDIAGQLYFLAILSGCVDIDWYQHLMEKRSTKGKVADVVANANNGEADIKVEGGDSRNPEEGGSTGGVTTNKRASMRLSISQIKIGSSSIELKKKALSTKEPLNIVDNFKAVQVSPQSSVFIDENFKVFFLVSSELATCETVEICVPLCYSLFLLFMYYGWNRDAFEGFDDESMPLSQFNNTLVMLMIQLGIESAIFMFFNWYMTRKFGFNMLDMAYFALTKSHSYQISSLVCTFIAIMSLVVKHEGTDWTFGFSWLH